MQIHGPERGPTYSFSWQFIRLKIVNCFKEKAGGDEDALEDGFRDAGDQFYQQEYGQEREGDSGPQDAGKIGADQRKGNGILDQAVAQTHERQGRKHVLFAQAAGSCFLDDEASA